MNWHSKSALIEKINWYNKLSLANKIALVTLVITIVGLIVSTIFSWHGVNQSRADDNNINLNGDYIQGDKIINNQYKQERNSLSKEITIDDIAEIGGIDFSQHKIYQKIMLNELSNNINGALLILIDKKLNGIEANIKKEAYYNHEELEIDWNINNITFSADGFNEAYLLVIDKYFNILYTEKLGRESARIDRIFPYKDKSKPIYILTRDYSIEFGSYNGPLSYFFEVNKNGIQYIFPEGLVTSLKSKWFFIEKEGLKEILYKTCRPALNESVDNPSFFIEYTRYSQSNNSWRKSSHKRKGFWENDNQSEEQDISEFYEKTIKK